MLDSFLYQLQLLTIKSATWNMATVSKLSHVSLKCV
jgi:hypothetical protein